jgi:hypothetical protein
VDTKVKEVGIKINYKYANFWSTGVSMDTPTPTSGQRELAWTYLVASLYIRGYIIKGIILSVNFLYITGNEVAPLHDT